MSALRAPPAAAWRARSDERAAGRCVRLLGCLVRLSARPLQPARSQPCCLLASPPSPPSFSEHDHFHYRLY